MGDADYRLGAEIARGGFGAVYRAKHLPTGADVAIKVLHDHLSDDPAIVERFRREAEVLRGLRSPHTVTTYELGELADGRLFIAMELLRGESLGERLARRGALPWQEALAIVRGVCAALAEAHAAGIVHRDLKPANIFLGDDATVKVLDFGIAKRGTGQIDADDEPTALTQVGQVLGTLEYMAPEQLVGGTVDARADVFSLGLVLYEMLTGDAPFGDPGNDAIAHVSRILAGSVTPPSRYLGVSPVTAAFDRAVAGCLAARAKDRFASVGALIDALEFSDDDDDEDDNEPTQIAAVAPMPVALPRPSLATLPLPALVRPARGSIAPLPVFVMHSYKHRAPVAAPVVNRPSRRNWLALAALALANIAIGLAVANVL